MKSKECEVTGCEKICPTCGHTQVGSCGKKAITKIKDVICDHISQNKPFWVCREHKKQFLKGNHYKEVPTRMKRGR